jgi:ribonuclease HI
MPPARGCMTASTLVQIRSNSLALSTTSGSKNQSKELIQLTKIRLQAWSQLRINWVAGHAGIPENERADELAGSAVEANL